MSNLNSVTLQGNLTADPEIVGSEQNVAKFTLAVNEGFGDNRETDFIDCVAFGKQVAVIREHLNKGDQIVIQGRLKQNRWQTAEGENRSKLEVRLNNFNGFFFTGRRGGGATSEASAEAASEAVPAGASEASGEAGGEPLF